MQDIKNKTTGKGWIKGTWNLYTDTQYLVEIDYVEKKKNWVCELNLDGKITRALGPSCLQAYMNARYKIFSNA